jgi:tetratricopeptide (TPR) repeat protein
MKAYQSAQNPEELAQELEEARKIQMGMLPQSVPELPGFQIAAHSSPAVAVGGDFYDFIKLGDDKLGIVVGDAVGHGIAAALLMAMTLTDFRYMASRYPSPSEVLNGVNRRLTGSMKPGTLVSSIYAVLDREADRLLCAMAGMQPWLIRADSGECVPVEPPGMRLPLGAYQKVEYGSCDVEMTAGDALVLFTDGIPEAMNRDDEFYSFERLESTLLEHSSLDARELLDAVLSDVAGFTGDRTQEDDITILVLKATESLASAPVEVTQRLITGEQKPVTLLLAMSDDELSIELVEEVNELVREHGGIVDAMGDNAVVALFGVPALHEDDAERAIASAQAIQQLSALSVGIDTGTAIIRSEDDIDYREVGKALRCGLQLANEAEIGQILVSERVHQTTYGAYQFQPMLQVQADDEVITAYPVLAPAEMPHRVRGIEGLYAPLIGREREMEQLQACVDDLLDGRGGIVSITGEAGIGKTRLVKELREYAGDRVQWLEGRCISYGQAMNYGPFRGIISSYLGILPTDTEEEMKAKLQKRVDALLPPRGRWNPIHVGQVFFPQYEAELRTASGDDYAKQYSYPILRNMFHGIADERPLVMVFEDLHWSDPTSLALLEFLMESVDEAPILYIWVYRPYRDSGIWRLREQADRDFGYCNTQLDLLPLPDGDTDALVSRLLHIPDIPENMRTLVQDKASGNPLYVEEIIRSFIDGEAVIRDEEYWRAAVESAAIVPSDTLQGVILSRVDGLEPDVKEILQVASILGDSFPLSLLERVADSETLSNPLRELERVQMLQRRRVGHDWEYHFRHPLIHDVVYHSLLPEDRVTLHEKTGSVIESMHSDRLDDYTDSLAHHYGHSGNMEKALHYLTLAGDKALELKSYWEAVNYHGMAMEKAEGLPDERRKKEVIIDLVIKRSDSRHMLGALKPDVEELEHYLPLVEELGDKRQIWFFYDHLSFHYGFMFEGFEKVKEYARRLASLGGGDLFDYGRYLGKDCEWFRSFELIAKGYYETAIAIDQQTLEICEADKIPSFNTLWKMSKSYKSMGHWDDSLRACQAVLDAAIDGSQSTRIIQGHAQFADTYADMGEWGKAIDECEAALNMSPSAFSIHWVVTPLGDAYCKMGQLDKGIGLLERWKEYARRVGRGPIIECEYCLPLAEGYLAQGCIDKARENADEALQIALEHGYAFHEAKAYCILGEILAPTDFPSSEDHFSRSLEIMQRIKARNEEGKTELSWGRARQRHGDMDQARAHLTRAAEIFQELGTTRYLEWTQEALAGLE